MIIAVFVLSISLSISGCGVKKSPYYQHDAPAGDKNIEFKLKEPNAI